MLAHLVSFVVHLHHVNFRQVRLHLFQVFSSLPVDDVENVLHLVGAHIVSGTDVLRRVYSERGLADWGEVSVLVRPPGHQPLVTGALRTWDFLTDTTDFWQLQLRLAVVMFEPLVLDNWHLLVGHHARLRVVVRVRAASHVRLVSSPRELPSDYFPLHSLVISVISVEDLYRT